jgi:hypothetical protein
MKPFKTFRTFDYFIEQLPLKSAFLMISKRLLICTEMPYFELNFMTVPKSM